MADKHFTKESEGRIGTIETVEDAHRAHHLATADPEPERDGLLTGPAHEEKYGLERADASAELWRQAGVHPTENRALRPGEDGYQDPADVAGVNVETADGKSSNETTAAARAKK